jgi:hypothetical protein
VKILSKFCQTNWNVAKNNVYVVVDEVPSQVTVYTCLILEIWAQRGFMRFDAIHPKCQASSEIGAKSFRLYYGHP